MMPEDIIEFARHILSKGDLLIFEGRFFDTAIPVNITSPKDIEAGKEYTLVVASLIEKYAPIYIKESNKWYFESYHSAAIEFCTPHLHTHNEMVNGRIYSKIGWLKEIEENKIFKAAYTRLERWLKKNYNNYDKTWWYSPMVHKWSITGGTLCLGSSIAKKIQLNKT